MVQPPNCPPNFLSLQGWACRKIFLVVAGGSLAMAEVFETLHHITREARDRLAAAGAMNVRGRSNECVTCTGFWRSLSTA